MFKKKEENLEFITKEIKKPTSVQRIDFLMNNTLLFCLVILNLVGFLYHKI
jgi:hypothetical protein